MLRKEMHKINPTDYITISDKWHGTSWIVGNVLTVRPLTWLEKLVKLVGVNVNTTQYDYVCSSRKVVKDQYLNSEAGPGFYGYDLWTDIKKTIQDIGIPKGFTLYGEAVGYLPNGKPIQNGYHYGCPVGNFDIFVYRITFTNEDGKTFELSDDQIEEFCSFRGLHTKSIFYKGLAKDLFPELSTSDHWHEEWLKKLDSCKAFNLADVMCPANNFEVPAEGIVVRVQKLSEFDAYKLKNFKFFEWETKQLDNGEIDLETAQSEEDE